MVRRPTPRPRLALLLIAGMAAAACGGRPEAAAAPPTRPPDLLLVTVDTLRADHLPTDGYHRDTAPHLARWAAAAVVYTNAQSTSSWTVPAVSSMVTGVAPPSHGAVHGLIVDHDIVSQEALPTGLPTLAEVLADAGYTTFGVTANGHLGPAYGFDRGFDRYACLGFFATAEHVNRQILEWREEIEAVDGPVFVWLHYFDPHFEYHRRDPWFSRYQPDATAAELATIRSLIGTWPALPQAVLDAPQRYSAVGQSLYDSEINYWDDRFYGLLDGFPRLARAATIMAADHGEEFFDHGQVHHGNNLHRETVRIPLIVRAPGQAAGGSSDATVSILDIPPTLAGWAGATPPPGWQGVPLGPQAAVAGDREVLAFLDRTTSRSRLRALIGREWKLVHDAEGQGTWLYDLRSDPRELADRADEEPGLTAAMLERLQERVDHLPPPPAPPPTVVVDPERLEQLRRIGYLRP